MPSIGRGRTDRRSAQYYGELGMSDFPEGHHRHGPYSPDDVAPPPLDKDSIRSESTTRNYRPIPPPKEGLVRSARSRGSTLHLVTTSDSFSLGASPGTSGSNQDPNGSQKPKKRPSQAIIAHWKNWTHWFIENTTRRPIPSKRPHSSWYQR